MTRQPPGMLMKREIFLGLGNAHTNTRTSVHVCASVHTRMGVPTRTPTRTHTHTRTLVHSLHRRYANAISRCSWMLFLAQPFWISVLSWSLESTALVLSFWLSVCRPQLGQPHVRLCVPAVQAWKVKPPRSAGHLPREGAAARVGTS